MLSTVTKSKLQRQMHGGTYFLEILPPAVQNPKHPKSESWLSRKLHGKTTYIYIYIYVVRRQRVKSQSFVRARCCHCVGGIHTNGAVLFVSVDPTAAPTAAHGVNLAASVPLVTIYQTYGKKSLNYFTNHCTYINL